MAKIALVGDLHLGVKGGNKHFLEFQATWIKRFIDWSVENNVDEIIQLGDFFDVRKAVDGRVLNYVLTDLKQAILDASIPWHVIVGNHDIYYRDDNTIYHSNIMRDWGTLPDGSPIVNVYARPKDVTVAGCSFLMLPWLDTMNMINLEKTIEESDSFYAVGHLEMAGFPMYKGVDQVHGLSIDTFNKFKQVWSGHYHTVSERRNLMYTGAPYHLTWADVVDDVNRGFWVFDTITGKTELIPNTPELTLFKIVEYDKDKTYSLKTMQLELSGKIVKIIVKEKESRHLAAFTKMLTQIDCIDYRVIDETLTTADDVQANIKLSGSTSTDAVLDTMSVVNRVIDESSVPDKDGVKRLANEVYLKAVAL